MAVTDERFNGLALMPMLFALADQKAVETADCDWGGTYTGLKAGVTEKRTGLSLLSAPAFT